MKKSSDNRQAALEVPMKLLGSIQHTGSEPVENQPHLHLHLRGRFYRKVLVAQVVYLLIPDTGIRRGHGPADTPSVHVVVRHLNKSLMH
jgi:hypothetical protein